MRLLEHRLNVDGFCTSPDHLISVRYTNVFGVVRVNRSITCICATCGGAVKFNVVSSHSARRRFLWRRPRARRQLRQSKPCLIHAKVFDMRTTPASTRYGNVARSFHWLVAALIVVQFLLAPLPENLPPDIHLDPPFGMDKLGLLARHESFGMTVLMLMVARALWRWRNAPPDLPETMKPAARFLARTTHIAFYVILIAMPLSGWMMTSAKGASASWFELWSWPGLIGQNDQAFGLLRATHGTLSRVLFVLVTLHVAAALKHHFWNKDAVLMRMLPFGRSLSANEKRFPLDADRWR